MTEREKILREGLERIAMRGFRRSHEAQDFARETIAKADAVPSSSLREAVKLERELIYDILLVAQMNNGFIPEHQIRVMMSWLDQPLPDE